MQAEQKEWGECRRQGRRCSRSYGHRQMGHSSGTSSQPEATQPTADMTAAEGRMGSKGWAVGMGAHRCSEPGSG